MEIQSPDPEGIQRLRTTLSAHLVDTPVLRCAALEDELGNDIEVFAKLEFLQRTGTFKARGALSVMLTLDDRQKALGVTAVSAGNHAIAVSYAAQVVGTHAKVVMTRSANPHRVERCRAYGAEIVIAEDVHQAFEAVERIREEENRVFVHPFEGEAIALGTATLGAEICDQVSDADALIIPVGGGGLCGGVSSAVRQMNPACRIYGVEPEGADTMRRSILAGRPESIDKVRTIADSLGAPFAMPYSFELCRRNVDEFLRVSDDDLKSAMRLLFRRLKMAVEPACAASTAALLGPLRERCAGQRVVILMCGSNIDWDTFQTYTGI